MAKLISFFLFVFIGSAILSAVMEGGGGIAATALSAAIDDDDVTISVDSTDGFLAADWIVIDDERILYTGKTSTTFTGCTRGYDGTEAESHAIDAMAYTMEASAINNAMGFNIAAEADSMGLWSAITIPFYFFTRTIPHIIRLNYSFLSGELAIIGWFFFAAGAGLIITLAISLAGGRRVG